MAALLRYRAGPRALERIRKEGLTPSCVRAVAGSASGPKWLVLAGMDRALLENGLVGGNGGHRPLLVGASAGAWRMLAMACRDPIAAHRALLAGYVNQVFTRNVRPGAVSDAYRRMLTRIFTPGEVDHLATQDRVDLGVHVARARRFFPCRPRWAKGFAMLATGLAQALSHRGVDWFFERVLLHSRPYEFRLHFDGSLVALRRDNLIEAALASGTVPFYMTPLRQIPGAPRGAYLDGGLTDYHLRQVYEDEGVTLLPHFQERIVSVWFDRFSKRGTPAATLDGVLQIYPSAEFIAGLPGGSLPERDDFFRFMDAPDERIRRWNEAATLGERLGEELAHDLERGAVPDLARPM